MTEEEFQIPYAIEAHVTPVAPELTPAGPEFTRIRCAACLREVTVPTAQLPLVPGLPARDDDGVRLALCAKCAFGGEANR